MLPFFCISENFKSRITVMKKDSIRLVAFLGNPGEEYRKTRHNAGFMAGDYAAGRTGLEYSWRSWQKTGLYAVWEHNGEKIYFLKPQTYMNLSGRAVQSLAAFYKIPPQQILVVYDDLALPFGRTRLRRDGSNGSHNGMGSVINCLGSSAIPRLRIGIGLRPSYIQGKDYVLGNFPEEEMEKMPEVLEKAWKSICVCVDEGLEKAMNLCNS